MRFCYGFYCVVILRERQRKWFLTENRFARVSRGNNQVMMRTGWCRDYNGVQLRECQQFMRIGKCVRYMALGRDPCSLLLACIRGGIELHARNLGRKDICIQLAHSTKADNAYL